MPGASAITASGSVWRRIQSTAAARAGSYRCRSRSAFRDGGRLAPAALPASADTGYNNPTANTVLTIPAANAPANH